MRCNACGEIFKAKLPEDAGVERYDESAKAIIALQKYNTGIPFHRLAVTQGLFNCEIPASTQFDMVEKLYNKVYPVYEELLNIASKSELFYLDDTTGKILSNPSFIKNGRKRKGVYTTGIIAKSEHEIALFFTSNLYASENLKLLMKNRKSSLDPPIVMWDALNKYKLEDGNINEANCLVHARRNFVDILNSFRSECSIVLNLIGKVYYYDSICNDNSLSPKMKFLFHQIHSKPVLLRLKRYMELKIKKKIVEPNAPLYKAFNYMLCRWDKLTRFLEVENCPLDNNPCERLLKTSILNRKNSYFYKTEFGARVADHLMSIIRTAINCNQNPFHYLVELQKNYSQMKFSPQDWMPWNYKETLKREEKIAA